MPRGGRRPGAGRPKGAKDSKPRLTEEQRGELFRALTDPVLVAAARKVVRQLMRAKRLQSAPLPASMTGVDAAKSLDEKLGAGNWWEHKGRLFWIEPQVEVQLAAAREVLSRQEPTLNRVDARVSGSYTLIRHDPNRTATPEAGASRG